LYLLSDHYRNADLTGWGLIVTDFSGKIRDDPFLSG